MHLLCFAIAISPLLASILDEYSHIDNSKHLWDVSTKEEPLQYLVLTNNHTRMTIMTLKSIPNPQIRQHFFTLRKVGVYELATDTLRMEGGESYQLIKTHGLTWHVAMRRHSDVSHVLTVNGDDKFVIDNDVLDRIFWAGFSSVHLGWHNEAMYSEFLRVDKIQDALKIDDQAESVYAVTFRMRNLTEPRLLAFVYLASRTLTY